MRHRKEMQTSASSQTVSERAPMEISILNVPKPPKRVPKFLVQGDSNRLRY